MKVIILAAGQGSRLGQSNCPKPLTRLASGKSIMQHQLEMLSRYVSLDSVLVVIGCRKEEIMEAFPNLDFIYNPQYATENTSKSLLRALKKCNDDVLWLNGDVVFHHSVLKAILNKPRTSMVVNIGPVGKEEVKYRQDASGRILAVSKNTEDPQGEALGINFCALNDLSIFCRNLERCAPNDYFEKGMELCLEEGIAIWSVPVDSSLCTEIDFPNDLDRANEMLKKWSDLTE